MKIFKLLFLLLFFVSHNCTGQDFVRQGNIKDENGSIYWTGTAIFSAINITTTTFNIIKIKKKDKPDKFKSNAIFGIISGSLQTSMGLFASSETFKNAYLPKSINIGIGVATIATSILRLVRKSPPKDTKTSYNFFYLPSIDGRTSGVGLGLVRKL